MIAVRLGIRVEVTANLYEPVLFESVQNSWAIVIEDGRTATAYAVEALRSFDHFHFRVAMREADEENKILKLAKPPLAGEKTWFREVYVPGHIKERDRLLFSA